MTFEGINSWSDFENFLQPLNNNRKGEAFEELTYWFFRLNEVHASQYDEVWRWSEVPERVKGVLNLPGQDIGIDLLLQKGQEYHAVQCKYHTNRHANVTFREVATFLSVLESNKRINLGYLCSSANGFSANFEKVNQHTKQVQRILSDTWRLLDESFFDRIRASMAGAKIEIKPFEPRRHQRSAIDKAVKHFTVERNLRGKLIFPCGAGKSLTGYWIKRALKSRKTLVAVPSLSLVKQTLSVYLRECTATQKNVQWICVCSDDGIGRGDDIVMYHNEIGVPCETNVDVISNWLIANDSEDVVVFSTYQSGRVIAEAARKSGTCFDLGVFDEAHKTVGAKQKLFSHLLFDENIKISCRIFMTATERFYSGSKDDYISMDDPEVYGETFAKMTFREAIEQELLTDYKVVTIDVQETEVAHFIRQNRLVELNAKWGREAEARSLASMLALRKAMNRLPIRNAVSFHSSIDKAKRSQELQSHITETYGYGGIDTYSVSGRIPTTRRNDIVQEFAASEKALITNARCLTEGVDVPNIDCIVFADPRRSKVDIVQALGRALRRKEGKKWGYVILPVIYDEQTGDIDNDNFEEILAVVRGLSSNDERIIEHFSERVGSSAGGSRAFEGNFELLSDFLNEEQLQKQLEIRLHDRLFSYDWNVSYNAYRQHWEKLQEEGGVELSKQLKSWASQQRTKHKKGLLEKWKVDKLDSIDFAWSRVEFKWNVNFTKCKDWLSRNDDLSFFEDAPNELIKWVKYQSTRVDGDVLSAKQELALSGLLEVVGRLSENKTKRRIRSLKEFYLSHDRWPVYNRNDSKSDESKLGVLCQRFRSAYKKNDLSQEIVKELTAIGFPFNRDASLHIRWNAKMDELEQIISSINDLSIDALGRNNYNWLKRNYSLANEGGLEQWQKVKIQALGLDRYWDKNYEWDLRLSELKKWVELHKKKPSRKDAYELFCWLGIQKRRKDLSPSQQALLNSVTGPLEKPHVDRNTKWNLQFEALQKYLAATNGVYPQFSKMSDSEESTLYRWVQAQRQAKIGKASSGRRKPLEKWRIDKLDSIGFEWEHSRGDELTVAKRLEAVGKFLANNHIDTLRSTNEHRTWLYLKELIELRDNGRLSKSEGQALIDIGVRPDWHPSSKEGYGKWVSGIVPLIDWIKSNKRLPISSQDNKEYQAYRRLQRTIEKNELSERRKNFLVEYGYFDILDSVS